MEKKGIKIAFLNYTYGVNQRPIPADQGYLIDLFTEQRVIQDIGTAKTMADCVVVGLHAGKKEAERSATIQDIWFRLSQMPEQMLYLEAILM